MAEHPETFEELFKFYHNYVKLLYGSVQADNHLPLEVLFELNAALDHISRRWSYGESEKDVVEKAYSHLKRSCLDVFKITVKRAIDQSKELLRTDVSIIDNGTYEKNLKALVQEIKKGAAEARRVEGRVKEEKDGSILSFAAWEPVYENCVKLEKDFYHHPAVKWAKKRGITHFLIGAIVGMVVELVIWALYEALAADTLNDLIKRVWHKLTEFL